MKKLLLTLFATLSFSFAATAMEYTNNLGFGVSLGSQNMKIDASDSEWKKMGDSKIRLDLQYLGYFENGLSFKGNIDLGSSSNAESYLYYSEKKYTGFDLLSRFAAGYGFIKNEKFYFGTFAYLGYSMKLVNQEGYKTGIGGSVSGAMKKIKYTVFVPQFTFGGDLTAIYTPKNKFSFYASVPFGMALGCVNYINNTDNETDTVGLKPRFTFNFIAGLSWKF